MSLHCRTREASSYQKVSTLKGALDRAPICRDTARRVRPNTPAALIAHLYGLTRDEFDPILGTFPLVLPDTDAGRAPLTRFTLDALELLC